MYLYIAINIRIDWSVILIKSKIVSSLSTTLDDQLLSISFQSRSYEVFASLSFMMRDNLRGLHNLV